MPLLQPVAVALLMFALAGCSRSGEEGKSTADQAPKPGSVSAPSVSVAPAAGVPAKALLVTDEDSAINLVSEMIRKRHLTSLRADCLSFIVEAEGATTYIVDVRENHTPTCGGDPAVSPRLFSFKVDRTDGKLSTDATDPADGDYQPIE